MGFGSDGPSAHFGSLDTDPGLPGPPGPPGGVTSVNGEVGVLTLTAADRLPVSAPTPTSINVGNNISADWSLAGVRVYAVDGTNGNDGQTGFADSADQTAGGVAAATVAAGNPAVALKTLARLAAIFPSIGNGRRVQIVIRTGTYADGLLCLCGVQGYGRIGVNGTETIASAGAVAFAGDAASNIGCGAITVPGLFAAGYNPIAAFSASAVKMLQVGGGAAALPAEPAAPLGWRIRFDVATTTVALRNIARAVQKVTGGDTIVPDAVLPAVPVGTDVFYLEKAGVLVAATTLNSSPGSGVFNGGPTIHGLAGVDVGGLLDIQSGNWSLGLVGCTSFTAEFPAHVATSANGSTPTAIANVNLGAGLRNAGTWTNGNRAGQRISLTEGLCVGAAEYQDPPGALTILSMVYAAGLRIQGGALSSQSAVYDSSDAIGSSTATAPLRIIGPGPRAGLELRGGRYLLKLIDIQNAGALPAILIDGVCEVFIASAISGAGGNTGVGLDLATSRGSVIVLGTTPTTTGGAGDVKLAGGQIVSWAVAALGLVDSAGNRIIAQGAPPTSVTKHSGVLIGGVGAVLSWLADGGITGGVNQVTAHQWPTSNRLALRLRAFRTEMAGATLSAVTLTLFKNGVATAMTVNWAAGVVGAKYDLVHPIFFSDTDTYDLKATNAGADAAAISGIAALVEWCV